MDKAAEFRTEWAIRLHLPPPMQLTAKGWRPRFGVISKNAKIGIGRYSVWPSQSRKWGEEVLQLVVHSEIVHRGLRVGAAKYFIKVGLLVPDRRKRDPQNVLEYISDFLQDPLDCDDSRFLMETMETEVVPLEESGICLEIQKLVPSEP